MALERTGEAVLNRLSYVLDMSALLVESVKVAFTERGRGDRIVFMAVLRQILFTGVEALRIVAIIAFLVGGAVIIESFTILPKYGGESVIGTILVLVVIRELGPLITAFIVIGRSGTAISTEMGYMMVNSEVSALESMGINPLRFLVLPRIAGVAAAIFCLSFIFNIMAIFGGYLFARFIVHYPFATYVADISQALGFWDVAVSGIKCLLFGVSVALICCFYGFTVRFSFTEIPQVTTRAVVLSIYVCFAVNILITAFFYI